ncbi:MAG: hypothetical protein V1769_06095 [Thermoplasmatota archaeon]
MILMIVAGLLSSQSEAQEIQFIIDVCSVRERIRQVIRQEAIKKLLEQEEKALRKKTPSMNKKRVMQRC